MCKSIMVQLQSPSTQERNGIQPFLVRSRVRMAVPCQLGSFNFSRPRSSRTSANMSRRQARVDGRQAFTLIELLVVVAVLAIIAAVAVPNLLEAQTRAKVSVARSNERVVAGGLAAYRVDHNAYPAGRVIPGDPIGVFSDSALTPLTTPTAYLSPGSFSDPFGRIRSYVSLNPAMSVAQSPFDPPVPSVNHGEALLYFHYPQLADRVDVPELHVDGFAVISIGPDQSDSFAVYYPFPTLLPPEAPLFGIRSAPDTVYEPTNGTLSGGDIARFGGSVPAAQVVGGGPP